MAGTTSLIFGKAMKKWYPNRGIVEAVALKTPMLDRMRKENAADWGGEEVTYPTHIGRNQGFYAGPEGGAYPTAGAEVYEQWHIPIRSVLGTVQFSGQILRQTESKKGAFISARVAEMNGLTRNISNDVNRMLWGFGRGTLATVSVGANSATQTVTNPGGVTGTTNENRYFLRGDVIGILNAAVPVTTIRGSQKVLSWSSAGTTITLDGAINSTTGDIIVRAAATGNTTDVNATSVDKEIMGLLGHVDDGTYVGNYMGVSRTTVPEVSSLVISSVGTLSDDILYRLLDGLDQVGEGKIDEFWGHHSMRRAYLAITADQRRYTGGQLNNPDAGTKAAKQQPVTFGDIPFLVDRHAPYGILFAPCWEHFVRFTLEEGHWDETGGSVLTRAINSSGLFLDAFLAFWVWRFQTHNERPNASGRLDGVNGTVVTVHSL